MCFNYELLSLYALVSDCAASIGDGDLTEPSDVTIEQLRKIERCLRLLEIVSYMNAENQNHLIAYQAGSLIQALYTWVSLAFRVCKSHMVVCLSRQGK